MPDHVRAGDGVSRDDRVERLIYCINGDYPRLFRWRNGAIEWRPKWRPWRWKALW